MAFLDFPFSKHLPSYMSHTEGLKYLQHFATHFDLHKHIQLSTDVMKVTPLPKSEPGGEKWEVRTKNWETNENNSDCFHSVFVCNGHYRDPYWPDIPGIARYRGHMLHSQQYREPRQLAGQRVVCLGAGYSGVDITVEVSAVAQEVILSHNKERQTASFPPNSHQAPGIERFTETGVIFKDGTSYECDTVIFCTGYQYKFPFLSPDCHPTLRAEKWVYPIYKHIVHAHHPSLYFLGLTRNVCPNLHFDMQAAFALKLLTKDIPLPSTEEMLEDIDRDSLKRKQQGLPDTFAHNLKDDRQWEYSDEIARLAGLKPIPQSVRKLHTAALERKSMDELNFRKYRYECVSDDDFIATRLF